MWAKWFGLRNWSNSFAIYSSDHILQIDQDRTSISDIWFVMHISHV